MALIKCPECNNSVSSIAPTCPHCGAPVADYADAATTRIPVTTVQQTSKKLKRWAAIGGVMFFVGLPMLLVAGIFDSVFIATAGIGLVIIGFIWVIVVSILIWWHHG